MFTWLEGASEVEGLAEVGRHLLAVQRGLAHALSLAGRVLKLKKIGSSIGCFLKPLVFKGVSTFYIRRRIEKGLRLRRLDAKEANRLKIGIPNSSF